MNAPAPETRFESGRLIERLPPVRGRLTENAPLSGVTWFRVGGPAEVMFKPVTKWATTVYNAATIPEIIRKAVRIARTEKPGAVHVELPEDVAKMEASVVPMVPRRFRRSVPDDKIVDRAFDMLQRSKRPLILAGNGCIRIVPASSCDDSAMQPGSASSVRLWRRVRWIWMRITASTQSD